MQASKELTPEITADRAAGDAVPEVSLSAPLPPTILPAEVIAARLSGRDACIVPALCVTLLKVQLPLRGTAQRLAALPYALEEGIAAPVEGTHHAICGQGADGQVLAAAVSRAVMEQAVADSGNACVTPEQMLLPIPALEADEPDRWAVWRVDGYALVRCADGTGFGVRIDMLGHLWAMAGRPEIDSYGAALPAEIAGQARDPDGLPATGPLPDLRQGAYARPKRLRAPLTALALVGVLGLAAHVGLAYADLLKQRETAAGLRTEATELLARNVPSAHVSDDPRLLHRRLAAGAGDGPGFLTVLSRVAQALAEAPVQVSTLGWSGRDETLALQVEAPGIDRLQSAETALRAALDVTAGAVTAGGGSARMTLTVRAAP